MYRLAHADSHLPPHTPRQEGVCLCLFLKITTTAWPEGHREAVSKKHQHEREVLKVGLWPRRRRRESSIRAARSKPGYGCGTYFLMYGQIRRHACLRSDTQRRAIHGREDVQFSAVLHSSRWAVLANLDIQSRKKLGLCGLSSRWERF